MADIELVIKIDANIANGIIYGHGDEPRNIVRSFQATIADAIKNGTPLPKGHGRLIDADKVITLALKQKTLVLKDTDLIDISSREFVIDYLFKDIKDYINNMPTIIEADKRSIRNEKNELWYIDRI